MSFTSVFGGNTIYPSDAQYLALALTVDTELQWPLEQNVGTVPVLAAIIDVTPSGPGLTITLPDAAQGSLGYVVTFYNAGADTFTVENSVGGVVLTVASGEAWNVYLRDNSTAAGAWRIFEMGAGTSSANAATLAGAGLVAITTTLNQNYVSIGHLASYAIVEADRAQVQVWGGGGAGIFTLPDPATVGAGWFVPVKNNGSGSVSVAASSGNVDGSASISLAPLESAFFVSDGTNFYTIGLGQEINSVFDFVQIDVAGSGDFVLAGAQLNRISYEFTGLLTGARNIIVPATIQQYWVENSTTGGFAFTVKAAGGIDPGVTIGQGERAILYCDGTNVVLAQTAGAVTFADGSAAAPSITFTSGSAMGLYKAATNTLGISTAGTARATVDAEGNWDFAAPNSGTDPTVTMHGRVGTDAVLALESTLSLAAASPGLRVRSTAAGGFATLSLCADSNTPGTDDFAMFQNGATNTGNIFNRANANLQFGVNNTLVLSIDATGNFSAPLATVAATANAGGAALPASPEGFLLMTIAGTVRKIPYYVN